MQDMRIAVIGGGAAGFFAAIQAKTIYPSAHVVLYEKSKKVLSKVRISGGGRCNVTNDCDDIDQLIQAYPRGGRSLKKVLHRFNTTDTRTWFEKRGVSLYAQDDGRVFPVSDDSSSIIDCLFKEVRRLGVIVELNRGVTAIKKEKNGMGLVFRGDNNVSTIVDRVVVATGGSPRRTGLDWLEALGHEVVDPVPSLFSFNMPGAPIRALKGIAVEHVQVSIQGTKLRGTGPLLITHWGMSGPAVLKVSAFGARTLNEMSYRFNVRINWLGESNQEEAWRQLADLKNKGSKKRITNITPDGIPSRLWEFLLQRWDIQGDKTWMDIGKKEMNRMVEGLTNDTYPVEGTTTFKEEFVTAGGVSLKSVNMNTMESKVCPGLFFAGEVLDIDGITGGYNFQAAWATGYVAGRLGN